MTTSVPISDYSPSAGGTMRFLLHELRPKGRVLTPFNVISVVIMLATAVILFFRFTRGIGAVTNLNQEYPWGIWIGFDVVSGVALAGGAYVITFMVYILHLEKYHAIVRVTVLNGFLAYVFYAGALLLDLGRPWNVVNPIIGNSFGVSSVLFLVAWHFALYMTALFIEFSPAIPEWLGWRRVHKLLRTLTVGAVILGITLSTLHQAGLGALFLMAKTKIHPLWYSESIPVLFFVSSIFAGLAMVIFEGTISHRVFHHRVSPELERTHDDNRIWISADRGSRDVCLSVPGSSEVHARTNVAIFFRRLGSMVPVRSARPGRGSHGTLAGRSRQTMGRRCSNRSVGDRARRNHEPFEYLRHCFQVV